MMNRRAFLTRATAAAIGVFALDLDRLLWVPGQRTFFDVHVPIRIGDVVWFNTPNHSVWHGLQGGRLQTYGSNVSRWDLHKLTKPVPSDVVGIGVVELLGPNGTARIITSMEHASVRAS
jgi:hypothetical protein